MKKTGMPNTVKSFTYVTKKQPEILCQHQVPRRGGSNEYPQSMFLSRNKKRTYTPVNQVLLYKVGVKGVKII